MDQALSELVAAWLAKSRSDLETARQLLEIPDGHLDAAIYHCQQAAEKALKAWLLFRGCQFPRTHDLEVLLDLAFGVDASLEQFREGAETLTPYVAIYRYPNEEGFTEPTRDETEKALELSKQIHEHVLNVVPASCHPAKK